MSRNKKQNNYLIIGSIFLAIIIILILVVVWLFSNNKETITSSDLSCESSSSEGRFFKPYDAIRVKHRIVMTFVNDVLNSASYTFHGTYNSDDKAENAEAWLHGDYNEHFKGTDLNPENYAPNFVSVNSKVDISLYVDRNKMNSVIMQVFNLNTEELAKFNDLHMDDFKTIYEKKGFTCTLHE